MEPENVEASQDRRLQMPCRRERNSMLIDCQIAIPLHHRPCERDLDLEEASLANREFGRVPLKGMVELPLRAMIIEMIQPSNGEHRHCEALQRRSNPEPRGRNWIASLRSQ
jgi:hypothetical protein